jgi:hypothetical protein
VKLDMLRAFIQRKAPIAIYDWFFVVYQVFSAKYDEKKLSIQSSRSKLTI